MILLTGCNCRGPITSQIDIEEWSSHERTIEILSSRITEKTNRLFNEQLNGLIVHIRRTGCQYTLNQVETLSSEDFDDFDSGCRIFEEEDSSNNLLNQNGCCSFNLMTRKLNKNNSIEYFDKNAKNTKIGEVVHLAVLMRCKMYLNFAYPLIKQRIFKEPPLSLNRAYLVYLIGQCIQFTLGNEALSFLFYRELAMSGYETEHFLGIKSFFPGLQFTPRCREEWWVCRLRNYIASPYDDVFYLCGKTA